MENEKPRAYALGSVNWKSLIEDPRPALSRKREREVDMRTHTQNVLVKS